jgi:hypothetical protein
MKGGEKLIFDVIFKRSWANQSHEAEVRVVVDEEDTVVNLPLDEDEKYDLMKVMKEVAAEYGMVKLFKQGYLLHEGTTIELLEVLPVLSIQ